jgi:signal transduction histidine kinase
MLQDFLRANRSELIERCRAKVAGRRAPRATPRELEHGVPLFLDQLVGMLPGGNPGKAMSEAQIQDTATRHGSELLRHDFSIDQVVHDYGDLCQSIVEIAEEQQAPITREEFGVLNIRLDNAIAGAVTEYARERESLRDDESNLATNQRLGLLAAEMRNLLNTAIVAISAIKGGNVGFGGATAAALDRSLVGLRGLIDRTLANVRLDGERAFLAETIEMSSFIAEVRVAAALEARTSGCELEVAAVEPGIYIETDRPMLASAVSNLLQNAFGCTQGIGHVVLGARAADRRVLVEVDDTGRSPERMARAGERSAVALVRQAVEAIGGGLHEKRNAHGGSLFTIDFPQKVPRERRQASKRS